VNTMRRRFNHERGVDCLDSASRSVRMSRIRSTGTQLENSFCAALTARGATGFERNARDLRGTPDVVFRPERVCVFLDSDFWHGWQYPRWAHMLKDDVWRAKIVVNRRRDRVVTRYLRRHGWIVVRLWEHALRRNGNVAIDRVASFLGVAR
jgi:DNA mismatch endonuclease (patch repair protein)